MAKRKAEFDAAAKHNKTPKENLAETEFSAEFARGEEAGLEFGDINAGKIYEIMAQRGAGKKEKMQKK
ncbi:hypothetical protein [Heyndrickxia coagulans]|uniref:hypothetical protein n=1 Tax=Heyndrickxia coagulans TaxID=1398 RepID=UPI0022358663|nr:hypothetical protein [Heyndrickxia coagulans]UZH07376.1 hypothetical protein ONG97_05500 [Heyndrickxia coagulans]